MTHHAFVVYVVSHRSAADGTIPTPRLRRIVGRAYTRRMGKSRSKESRVSIAEYLRAEEHRTIRYEYLRGEVYAMSGGTSAHSQIAANVIMYLGLAVRGSRCRVFTSDFKVQPSDEAVYYPDVTVACEPPDRSAVVTEAPCFVVEVTSRSTARIDRGEKLEQYRKSVTLQTYLIVDQFRKRVTRHWRDAAGEWRTEEFTDSGTIPVPCPEIELTLDQIYEEIEMSPLRIGEPEVEPEADEYAIET
jgi:Uma2 family endonuclease